MAVRTGTAYSGGYASKLAVSPPSDLFGPDPDLAAFIILREKPFKVITTEEKRREEKSSAERGDGADGGGGAAI